MSIETIPIDKIKKKLNELKEHYHYLSEFMKSQEKTNYYHEHKGKVKFIEYLLFLIEKIEKKKH